MDDKNTRSRELAIDTVVHGTWASESENLTQPLRKTQYRRCLSHAQENGDESQLMCNWHVGCGQLTTREIQFSCYSTTLFCIIFPIAIIRYNLFYFIFSNPVHRRTRLRRQKWLRNLYARNGCFILFHYISVVCAQSLSHPTSVFPPSFCWFCIHEFMTIYISGTVPITIQCEERQKKSKRKVGAHWNKFIMWKFARALTMVRVDRTLTTLLFLNSNNRWQTKMGS